MRDGSISEKASSPSEEPRFGRVAAIVRFPRPHRPTRHIAFVRDTGLTAQLVRATKATAQRVCGESTREDAWARSGQGVAACRFKSSKPLSDSERVYNASHMRPDERYAQHRSAFWLSPPLPSTLPPDDGTKLSVSMWPWLPKFYPPSLETWVPGDLLSWYQIGAWSTTSPMMVFAIIECITNPASQNERAIS